MSLELIDILLILLGSTIGCYCLLTCTCLKCKYKNKPINEIIKFKFKNNQISP